MMTEQTDPKDNPLDEVTEDIEEVLKNEEDIPNQKSPLLSSIQIGPTRFSFGVGAERSATKSLIFYSDEETSS